MKVRITLHIRDKAPNPDAVLENIKDMLKQNRWVEWYTIQPKRLRKLNR